MATDRILLRALKGLAFLMVLSLAPLSFGQSVVVRILNVRDGQGIANRPVEVRLFYAKTAYDNSYNVVQHYETDAQGKVTVPMPLFNGPATIDVAIDVAPQTWHCSCHVFAKTDTVLKKGITATSGIRASRSAVAVERKPGSIVFLARPASFLEKAMYKF
jgi:hypothetical protein